MAGGPRRGGGASILDSRTPLMEMPSVALKMSSSTWHDARARNVEHAVLEVKG
jgi:hypothetical protein